MKRLGAAAGALVLTGALLAHGLDEAGLLPFVHEAEAVREYAQVAVLLTTVGLGVAVGALVARLDRRRIAPRTLLALVVAGQAAGFASFEVAARLAQGLDVGEALVEPSFLAGVAMQVALATAFVGLAGLAAYALARLRPPAVPAAPTAPPPHSVPTTAVIARLVVRPWQGRAPPVVVAG